MDHHVTVTKHRVSDARPEFVALGFLYAGSTHGYDLYRQFERHLGQLWHISQSQLYATLKRLESRGFIAGAAVMDANGPERRCFSLTDKGRSHFDSWLAVPSIPGPRFIKLEFLTRLFFARFLGTLSPTEMLSGQISAIRDEVRRLEPLYERLAVGDTFSRLGASFRLAQLRSIRAWLEDEVRSEFK